MRCHALCQSSILLDIFLKAGLIYEVNLLLPGFKNLFPFYHCNGLKRLPFFWEDDVNCLYNTTWEPSTFLKSPGLKIFNFHPIHVFLNTENMKRYEEIKEKQGNPNLVKAKVNKNINEGTKVFLKSLIAQAKTREFVFGLCSDIEVEK